MATDRDATPRYLQFSSLDSEHPITANCSVCDRRFTTEKRAEERIDDAIIRLREEFEQHECRIPSP